MSEEATKSQLESALNRVRSKMGTIEEEGKRARHAAVFIGGVMASSAYRSYLAKNKKPMPKILGVDADYIAGGALLALGFFDMLPVSYEEDAMYLGVGLLAGAAGNAAAGWVNPAVKVSGENVAGALGAGRPDVSAHRGEQILDAMRRAALEFLLV